MNRIQVIHNCLNKIAIIFIVSYTTILTSCNSANKKETLIINDTSAPETILPRVKITPISYGNFEGTIRATGKVISKKIGPAVSEASGRLNAVFFEEGSFVNEGDLLATIDVDRLQLDLEQARNELDKAAFDRQIKIIEAGGEVGDSSVTDKIIDKNLNIQTGYPTALTKIEQLKFEISRRKIYAPFSGIVTEKKLFKNQQIKNGQDLCTILDRSSIRIEAYVLDEDITNIRANARIFYQLPGNNKKHNANVMAIRSLTDETSNMITFESRPQRSNDLIIGQRVQITIPFISTKILSVPKSAIVLRNGRNVVFTYDESQKVAKWNYVEIGRESDSIIEILSGLSKENKIIVQGNLNLANDMKVEIQK